MGLRRANPWLFRGWKRLNSTEVSTKCVVMLFLTVLMSNTFHYYFKVRKVTLIEGDGIGPEISNSVKKIFLAADVSLS